MTPIDIRPADLATVRRILREHVPALEVRAFGSRVAWNARETSDLDLALMTDQPLSMDRTARLRAAFTGSDLPFRVDIVDWATASERFRQRILADHVVLMETEFLTKDSTEVSVKATRRGEPDGWRERRLGDVITLKRGYDLPERERVPGPVPVVSSSGVSGYHQESKVAGPGVVTGRYGTLGKVYFIPGDFWPLNTTLYVRDFKGNDPRFVTYLLQRLDFSGHSDKAAVPGLNRNHIHQEPTRIPTDVGEQRAIAHILGTLDDKIELNRRMNATLGAMARALFRSWFVEFDPVRAKMEGRETGLPKEIADLFPDRLVDSELGEIPEGWQLEALDSVADFQNGLALQKFRPSQNEIRLPVVKIAQLRAGKANSGEWASASIKPECIIEDGDVVFSWSGSLLVRTWCGGRAGLNQHLFKVTSERYPKWFYLHSILSHFPEFQRIAADKVTTMGHIRRHHLTDALCVVPPDCLITRVSGLLGGLLERRVANEVASRTLVSLRDALLPKLVSGELRVTGLEAPSMRDDRPAPVATPGA